MERSAEVKVEKTVGVDHPVRSSPAKDYKFLDTAQIMRRVSAIERKRRADAVRKLMREQK